MTLHGQCFIADRLSAGTGRAVRAVSPLDRAVLEPPFSEAGQAEVDAALEAAEAAFAPYSALPPADRAAFLEAIADEILALGDDLIARARQETGLGTERLVGERGRTMNQLRLFAQVVREGSWVDARIDTALPDRQPLPRPDLRRMLVPLGPVVVFGSSNFPLAFSVAGGDCASALATGNTVVIKAHRGHPGTSEMVATAIRRAVVRCGVPAGVFSMLHGPGAVMGQALVRHPLTRAVGFTGSRSGGRALFDAAAARPEPIPVFAEMSSLNPVFVLPAALKERGAAIAEALKNSVTLGVGQFCTKPGLIFGVAGEAWDAFQLELVRQFEGASPATMLHQGICEEFHAGLARVKSIPGVRLLGCSLKPADPGQTQGAPIVLATDAANFLRHPELTEEVFGPFALCVTAGDIETLETLARRLEGQLTATLQASPADLEQAAGLAAILTRKAGRLVCNGYPTGVEVCHAMNHGGPYPATTDTRFTSVGTTALQRFVRPVCHQGFPARLLPDALKDGNPLGIWRLVNSQWTQAPL
jgi:NADP-dependent aldehyde dehydrogenase